MATEWFNSFINSLERLLDKPPYLIFVFIGAVFVVISLISRYSFEQTWVFFLYSVVGTVWRYIERDFMRLLQDKHPDSKLLVISIYHFGNITLLLVLFHYLNFL